MKMIGTGKRRSPLQDAGAKRETRRNPRAAHGLVALAWFEPENYAGARAVMSDAEALPATYEEWLGSMHKALEGADASKMKVMKVNIEPARFLAWCQRLGISPDARARQAFANEEAYRRYLEQEHG
jgi:hypothetical protein